MAVICLCIDHDVVTSYPQVVVVRVPTPAVQSDSDITVLRHLEKLGCRLINRPQGILNCVNKFWTFQEMAGHGIPLPDTFSYGGHDDFAKMIEEAEPLGYPLVVKNTRGRFGKSVILARDKQHLSDLTHLIQHDAPYLFQKYMQDSHGKHIRVVVVGGRVIGSTLLFSTDVRIQSNRSQGGMGMMYSLSEHGKQLAIQSANILGMDICSIDLFMKDDGSFVFSEANANVGFNAFDQACNVDLGSIIADYALSLLPSRLTRKMSMQSVVSSTSETSEPEVCAQASAIPENLYTMCVSSPSSESDPDLAEVQHSSTVSHLQHSALPGPSYTINKIITSQVKA
ncbi:N-acetylaspartylglutamate synthase A [Protopterus annectens]|uniref:N-acetylaspartylglutamate synthase A n=1 Tax=Protopterus annectens TaxID=7888 RepID=UPI001CFBA5DA|nr:N-acetylaspartylglutamate synthase A [Protopterus annectens]